MTAEIEKGLGHDWTVFYRDGDEPEILSMSVFGVLRIEDAVEEARWSLEASPSGIANTDYVILSVTRDDFVMPAPMPAFAPA